MSTYDQSQFRAIFESEFTYLNGFLRNTRRYANRTALACPLRNRQWTYVELNREGNQLANALAADGVGKGGVVAYQLLNSAEFAFLYLATQKLGAVSCPINFRLSYGETAHILDDSKPRVFFYDAAVKETAEKALGRAKHQPAKVVMVDPAGTGTPLAGSVRYARYVAGAPDGDPGVTHPSTIYDETTRLYTSGTTGLPKAVPMNNIVEIMSAHDVIMHFPLTPMDRTMNMTPWFHRGGLYSGGPNPVFYVGAEAVVLQHFDPNVCLDYVERYRLTYLIGAPPNLKMLTEAQLKRPRDLSSLKGIVTMGAPLEREACIKFQKVLTPNIFNGYGTTEAFWNTFLRPYDLPDKAGSAGRSCTDDDVAVVKIYPDRMAEPDDFVAKDGKETGEVIVRAVGKCAYTYINDPERAARTFYKGWVYIGDLGTWDEEEYVTIVGRKDDMVNTGGEKVHPVQVEGVLNEHPKVAESLVTGLPDEKWGEVVVAYVIRRDPSLTAKALEEHCLNHPMLARYKRPRYYRFVESIPLTATGKKMHYVVKAQAPQDFAAGLLVAP
ncbi:MAG: AMP-binding protein [Candidatus Methylomirabilota bacterium]|jgi:acyl-coenzyme A synthetase/AMP-(fatty) acid ligase